MCYPPPITNQFKTRTFNTPFSLFQNNCSIFVAKLQCRDYKMSKIIEHSGIIHQINGKHIRVQITQESACSACHAKGACTAADKQDKYIDVESAHSNYQIGEKVILYGQSSMGLFAVLLAFVLPFLLILGVLFILNNYMDNEALAGTIALGALIPYFMILSLFNTKLQSKLKFYIK